MRRKRRAFGGEDGFALLTVTIFALVLTVVGTAFFAISSYETKGALYREASSEAFYLADGAIERARAKFLGDRTWRDGYLTPVQAGRGSYTLSVRDTTFMGHDDAVRLLATGTVQNAVRKVESVVLVPPTAYGLTMLIMGDAYVNGNLCVDGGAHVNGDVDPGHFTCEADVTGSPPIITPPPIYTDPAHFPNNTYFYVKGVGTGNSAHAQIFDAAMQNITSTFPDSMTGGMVTWDNGQKTYTFEFRNADIATWFDDVTGHFRRTAGTEGVVVNFGESPPNATDVVSDVIMQGPNSANALVTATIVNTRFIAADDTPENRQNWQSWQGGVLELQGVTMEPFNGVAAVIYDFEKPGSAQVTVGTEAYPALLYVTRDVAQLNANFVLRGSVICLRDWHSQGNPELYYDPGFLENLPDYLRDSWPQDVSGTMDILRWREIAAN